CCRSRWRCAAPSWEADVRASLRFLLMGVFWLASSAPLPAHEGPPFPIVMDRREGPFVVSIWTDPDVGTGKFFVILEPAPGTTLPDEIGVEVCVWPLTGRLPEAC